MAEGSVPESKMLAIMGHMSRAMLKRYSHIRMVAKRQAVESLMSTVFRNVPYLRAIEVSPFVCC